MGVIRHCWISWLMCKTMHFMLGGQYIREGIELGSQMWSCTSKQIRFMKPKLLYLTNQWETNIIGLQVLPMVVKWLDGCISEVLLVIYIGLKSLSLSIKGDQIVNLKNFILTLYIKNQNPRSKLMQNLFFFFVAHFTSSTIKRRILFPKVTMNCLGGGWEGGGERSSWIESLEMTQTAGLE